MASTSGFSFDLFSKTVVTMTKALFFVTIFLPLFSTAQKYRAKEIQKFKGEARAVTIIRDNWGIPHIYGKTDADAVFGLMYAECEDNFKGIEQNY